LIGFMTSHQVEGLYRVGPKTISATRRGLARVTSSLSEVLRLMDLSSRYDCCIDHPTWRAIRQAMMGREDLVVDPETAKRFLSFLSHPSRLGPLLRRLHEIRALEQLVPGYDHARCLLQFNEYHKYTVDEHSIRSVERATEFQHGDHTVGRVYREIKSKQWLHLALLVHDLGKGYAEDHSEVGARIALQVAENLHLSEQETETLRFLVHRHLMLSHLAFRRDTSDESIVLQHVAEIGSPALLQMLFVLTCADLAAVGPGVLNLWKMEVLTDLYQRMMGYLSGGDPSPAAARRQREARKQLTEQVGDREDATWYIEQIEQLPAAYLEGPTTDAVLADLERLRQVSRGDAIAWGRYLEDRQVVEYSVAAYEDLVPGIFHRLTGALTGHGLQILSAEIHSLANHLCLDRFYVVDADYRGEPPDERFRSVTQTLTRVLREPTASYPTFRRIWQPQRSGSSLSLHEQPTRVRVDNTTSDRYTIIDVFTADRPGLLYVITRALFDLGLSVFTARIGTHLDQVVDVFYVTDNDGRKLPDDEFLQQIRDRLLEAIAEFQSAAKRA
jgi:[protein-PII] uridylyltransferase